MPPRRRATAPSRHRHRGADRGDGSQAEPDGIHGHHRRALLHQPGSHPDRDLRPGSLTVAHAGQRVRTLRRPRHRRSRLRAHVRGLSRRAGEHEPGEQRGAACAPLARILEGMDTATTPLIIVTEQAAHKARQLAERDGRPDAALRVRVTAGGCPASATRLRFEDEPAPGDQVVEGPRGFPRADRRRERPDRDRPSTPVLTEAARGEALQDGEPAGDARVRAASPSASRPGVRRRCGSRHLPGARHRRVDLAVETRRRGQVHGDRHGLACPDRPSTEPSSSERDRSSRRWRS